MPPLGAVIGKRPARHVYAAAQDTFCYEIDAGTVDELVRISPPFQAFCYSRASALPQALLHSSIFWDFRPVWGEESPARDLRAWLNAMVKDDQRFLRAMAQCALESRPALGFFSDFATSGKDGGPQTIDLKARGSRIDFGDSFHAVLRQDQASSDANILVHGIGATAQTGGGRSGRSTVAISRICRQVALGRLSCAFR